MSDVATPRRTSSMRLRSRASEMQSTRYDSVASMIVSLLIIVGGAVICLAVVWLSARIFARQTAVPVVIADVGSGEGPDVGEAGELDEPTEEEIAQEAEIPEPDLQDTLSLVTESVASSDLADPTATDSKRRGRRGLGGGGGNGEPGIPREQRWEVLFLEGSTMESYSRQLDFFKIELGAISGTNDVFYAWNLSAPSPSTRTNPGAKENRLYMTWRQGGLKAADRELMRRAGLRDNKRIIVQFYPPDLENQLAALEQAYRGLKASQIRKTRFAVRAAGEGFEFFVKDQFRL